MKPFLKKGWLFLDMIGVYILYSKQLDRYYTGQSINTSVRLDQHNSKFYRNSYTSRADDWELFLAIPCTSKSQAIRIERYIKAMKSRNYIERLKNETELIEELKRRFT